MEGYPDPDEEYELLYREEMEAMREMEEEVLKNQNLRRSKNSLSFDSPSFDKENVCGDDKENNVDIETTTVSENSKKRYLSSECLIDITDVDILERPAKKLKNDIPLEVRSHEYGTTSLRIPKWPFISVNTDLGEKLYVKLNHGGCSDCVSKHTSYNYSSGLLVTPFKKLKEMAEETLRRSINSVDVEENLSVESDLWVEQYKPRTYFDLLSDEAVNRTLLNWLKMWDKVVFNKEVKVKSTGVNDDKMNAKNELDKDGRPHYKIALLCGPPGLGKTTLAHVAAELAGYNVLEVNASDDRTIEALSTKLEAATQIQSVMGNRKPYCLILDEIDGAPAPTVEFILNYLNGKMNEKSKKGKKDKPSGIVKRPVICICNELYTPSLRQLRQQAFVVHFPHTSSTKLAQRLLDICRKQDIKTDLSTLALLCDKAQNDIRSCILTLYFFKSKNGQRFKSADVIKSSVGQKDIQKGMFNLWKEIFQTPIKRGNFFSSILDKGKEEEEALSHINYSKRAMDTLHHIVHMVQSAGDYDRLLQGVFENFPKSKYSRSTHSLVNALEWFTWFDLLDSSIKKEQNFVLMPYLPYGFAAWHTLFSSNTFWKISFPSIWYENHVREMRCKQILDDVLRGLKPTVRSYNSGDSVLLDVLPMFNVILVPPIRCVNPTLFNENEKKEFKQLIDIMIEYGLNFIQQRNVDGTYSFQYDPNIEELSCFNTLNASNSRSFSYNMKQTISHEVELERLRRTEENQTADSTQTVDNRSDVHNSKSNEAVVVKKPEAKPKEIKFKENEPSGTLRKLNFRAELKHSKKSEPETVKLAEVSESEAHLMHSKMQYKDFFGRVVKIKDTSPGDKASETSNNPVKSPVWFCFKEGYNNAVKKDITMADIL